MADTLTPKSNVGEYNNTTDVVVAAPGSGEQDLVRTVHYENKSGATEVFIWEINRNATTTVMVVKNTLINAAISSDQLNIILDGDENDVLNTRLDSGETGTSTWAASWMRYS